MKIAIDESGDSGRKLWRGSSRWFVLAAAIVPDVGQTCGPTCQAIAGYQSLHMNGVELHFAHNSHQQHIEFFRYMQDKDFVFAAVAMDKRQLLKRKPYVLRSKMSILQYGLDELFKQLKPWLDNPVVLMDSNGSRHFNKGISRHMYKLFGSRHKGDIRAIDQFMSVDSKQEPLVQLADYIAGAVRHHVDDWYQSTTFEDYLADRGKIIFL